MSTGRGELSDEMRARFALGKRIRQLEARRLHFDALRVRAEDLHNQRGALCVALYQIGDRGAVQEISSDGTRVSLQALKLAFGDHKINVALTLSVAPGGRAVTASVHDSRCGEYPYFKNTTSRSTRIRDYTKMKPNLSPNQNWEIVNESSSFENTVCSSEQF